MFLKFALRDTVLLVVCLALWQANLSPLAIGKGWFIALEIATALVTLLVSFLVHEWGHLLGALLWRGKVYAPHRWYELFLFHFDCRKNNAQQFLAMSIGGFVASGLVIATIFMRLPLDTLAGELTLLFVGIGVIATVVLEFPTTWRVARGGPLPSGFVYEPFEAAGV